MKIHKDTSIREIWHRGFERDSDPDTIVIHGTGGGGTYGYVARGGDDSNTKRKYRRGVGLFHYLIERSGKIIEIIDPDRWTHHSHRGQRDKHTIGIELVNNRRNNSGDYTKDQYDSLFYLVFFYLMKKYHISVIMSHKRSMIKYVPQKKPKDCPGPNFDWKKLEKQMRILDIKYKTSGQESYWGISRE